eukprot:CAMPEP_0172437952 /NCGR_PEP_ID=MMETSP1064-20121228/72535_1 /TAXON_ID=202472 /ORGANISM="Aulacoseira subarctica , Strain CCAP 1002/5" /LENGTH=445 /DNA_ID=CAMNT_0013186469 /DNA_START=311 /DNA_END=1648 /DNA_ORIENTATION=-
MSEYHQTSSASSFYRPNSYYTGPYVPSQSFKPVDAPVKEDANSYYSGSYVPSQGIKPIDAPIKEEASSFYSGPYAPPQSIKPISAPIKEEASSYYSGPNAPSQVIKPIDATIKEETLQANKASGPFRPDPPKTPFMCFASYREEEMLRNRQIDNLESSDKVRQIAQEWKNITPRERTHWNEVARQEKIRYDEKRKNYTGWAIPKRRAKKHPLAPKRPMSAFLRFSQTRRKMVKDQNPDMSNTDVSRLLGEMWHSAPPADRNPYIEQELDERNAYKIEIAKWRSEYEKQALSKNSPDNVATPTEYIQPSTATDYGGNNPRYEPVPEYSNDGWESYGGYNGSHHRPPTVYQRHDDHENYHSGNILPRMTHSAAYNASSAGRHETAPVQPPYAEQHRYRPNSPPRGTGSDGAYYHPRGPFHHANEAIPYYPVNDSSSARFPRPFASGS